MVTSNRLRIIALGIVTVLAIGIGVWTWPSPPKRVSNGGVNALNSSYRSGDERCDPARITAIQKLRDRESKAIECAKDAEEYRLSTADLIQQTRAANAAEAQAEIASQQLWTGWLQTIGGFLTLAAAVSAAIFARDAAVETKRSVNVSMIGLEQSKSDNNLALRAQFEESRPWVIFRIIGIRYIKVAPLEISNRQFYLPDEPVYIQAMVEYEFECVGGRPAYDIFWYPYLHSGAPDWEDAKYSTKEVIHNWTRNWAQENWNEDGGKLMFPGQKDTGEINVHCQVPNDEIDRPIYPTLTIPVGYKSAGGGIHQTTIIYDIRRTGKQVFSARMEDVPREQILIQERYGATAT